MTFALYHKGWLLYETTDESKAFEKAQQYRNWFSNVEVRKIANDHTRDVARN